MGKDAVGKIWVDKDGNKYMLGVDYAHGDDSSYTYDLRNESQIRADICLLCIRSSTR